jgi:hypothetical protein
VVNDFCRKSAAMVERLRCLQGPHRTRSGFNLTMPCLVDREANFIVKSVFVDCLREWQIVLHNAINTNFSAFQWRENETALYAMHGVMNNMKSVSRK